MSKKHTKRMSSPEKKANQAVETSRPVVRTAETRPVTSTRSMTGTDFNPDYSYVKKDLVRIATLAVAFFVVLIALSFIL